MRMTTEVFVQLLWEVDLDLLFFSFSWYGLKLWSSGYEPVSVDIVKFCRFVFNLVRVGYSVILVIFCLC